ncbi:hypothetical protein FHR83_007845 [Actinoplanes campanulatus]|uniref:Uncharacterized protein n=1 Tax=Actinoplanes campanulatus TaxID=113559 RepID=A0A7W5APW8_9ACTN|nr:hypothetical protein [Actinoplanes campanulatus]GGN28354.1 hypothetical protein GCM10010109_46600 [Actinoplanes campanulatus]GID39063.1 hypothetical protein Aca09nite_55690 [Actinoplanes campanulatus]
MTRTIRSRRADEANRPLYARALRLRRLAPSGLLCFVFLEGAVVLGILLALAELVSWWGVLVLPVTVALMVKFNDLVAGVITPRPVATETASARVSVLRPAAMPEHGPASSETLSAYRSVDETPGAPDSARYAPERKTAEYGPAVLSESLGDGFSTEDLPGVPAVGYPGTYSRGPAYGDGGGNHNAGPGHGLAGGSLHAQPAVTPATGYASATQDPAEDAGAAGKGAPIRRPWAEQLDMRQQMARQTAARRYE